MQHQKQSHFRNKTCKPTTSRIESKTGDKILIAKIFYFTKKASKEEPHGTFFNDAKVTKKMLDESGLKNFVQVDTHEDQSATSKQEYAEKLFALYNDGTQSGNPLGTPEGQQKIRSIGASHTSMSINDFVVIDDEVLIVDACGFLNIGQHSSVKEVTVS
jgi:hypothetical protein